MREGVKRAGKITASALVALSAGALSAIALESAPALTPPSLGAAQEPTQEAVLPTPECLRALRKTIRTIDKF